MLLGYAISRLSSELCYQTPRMIVCYYFNVSCILKKFFQTMLTQA